MFKDSIHTFLKESTSVLKGKREQLKLVLCNTIAGGHTLIEDAPGVGKTTLVKLLAKASQLTLSRIQFTNDLLPSDILGAQIFDPEKKEFRFHKGPIFGEIILADELNRATPKTQSALLQAMEERKITLDTQTYDLPEVFIVIATQNPHSQLGTYGLPESQLDRFSLKLKLGHPDKDATIEMLKSIDVQKSLSAFPRLFDREEILLSRNQIEQIKVEETLYHLIYTLLENSRTQTSYIPLSNRAAIDLVKVCRSWAYLESRDYVIPDDIHLLFPYVCGHRLVSPESSSIELEHQLAKELLNSIL